MTFNLAEQCQQKKVVFVSTKNLDYLRNTQEILILKENASDVQIIAYQDKSYAKRIIKVYWHLLLALIKGWYDVLFIGFAPQFVFLLLPFVSKNKTLVIDFFISFYDTLVDDRKKFKADSFMAKIIHAVDHYVINRTNFVIADTEAHKKYFAEEFAVNPDKIQVLYIEADTTIFTNQTETVSTNPDVFTVLYFGSILPVQGTEVILAAMRELISQPQIQFVIIGPIVDKFHVKESEYPNTRFISWLPQKELAKEISKADLCLAGHFSAEVGKANRTIAGKTYIYKAMGKPVILGDSDANHELFVEDQENYYVKRGDSAALAAKITEIAENSK